MQARKNKWVSNISLSKLIIIQWFVFNFFLLQDVSQKNKNQKDVQEKLSNKLHDETDAEKKTPHLPITPEKKTEIIEEPNKKRKRQQIEEEIIINSCTSTPVSEKNGTLLTLLASKEAKVETDYQTPSAKKRLIMEESQLIKNPPVSNYFFFFNLSDRSAFLCVFMSKR